jgi:hypothetical protein
VEQDLLSLDEYVFLWAWRGSQEGDYALENSLMWDVINASRSVANLLAMEFRERFWQISESYMPEFEACHRTCTRGAYAAVET